MKVLITAGPTYEPIDPVRFIGNRSTGKMGFAIAEAFAAKNIDVLLITGPVQLQTVSPRIDRIDIESASDMYQAVVQNFKNYDVLVFCAAVADFTPEMVHSEKIKRKSDDLIIRLRPTQDIAATIGKQKTDKQFLVGFALETNDEQANAMGKMQRKNLDMIVLNSLNDKGAGFGYDTNKVTIITRRGETIELPLLPKTEVADHIVATILGRFE